MVGIGRSVGRAKGSFRTASKADRTLKKHSQQSALYMVRVAIGPSDDRQQPIRAIAYSNITVITAQHAKLCRAFLRLPRVKKRGLRQ
jgi:hypothetical protein